MNLNPASITELRFLLDEDKEKGLKNIPKKILTKEGKITKKAIEYNKKLIRDGRTIRWYDEDSVFNKDNGRTLKKKVIKNKKIVDNKKIDKNKLLGSVLYPNNVNIESKTDKKSFATLKRQVFKQINNKKTFSFDVDLQKINYDELLNFLVQIKSNENMKRYNLLAQDDKGGIITLSLNNIKNRLKNPMNIQAEGFDRTGSNLDFIISAVNTGKLKIIFRYNESKNNTKHNGAFFKYYHNLDFINLDRYDIYRENPYTYIDNCFIIALREGGLCDDKLAKAKAFIRSMNVPLSKLTEIANQLEISISVKRLKGMNDSTTTHYGLKDKQHFHLGLIDEHFFIIDKKTNITLYALNNFHEICDIPDYNKIYKKISNKDNGKSIYKKSNERFVDSFTLVKTLIKNKETLLTRIPINDLVESQFYNEHVTEEVEELNYSTDPDFGNVKKIEPIDRSISSDVKLIFFDFETYTDQKKHEPYLCSVLEGDGKKGKSFRGEMCAKKMLEWVKSFFKDKPIKETKGREKGKVGDVMLIAHNLRYDFTFILEHICALNPVLKGNSIMGGSGRLYFEKGRFVKVNFQDSNNLCPMKLAKFPKTFGFETNKELMPYDLYTKNNVVKRYIPLEYCLSYIKEEDKKHYLDNIKKWDCMINDKVDIILYSQRYCEIDCKVLKKGYTIFTKWIRQITGLNVINYCSIASLGLDYMITSGVFEGCYKVSGVIQNFIQKCVVGGRCMTRDNKKWEVKSDLSDFDAVSLYPSAMNRIEGLLQGTPKVIKKENLNFEYLNDRADGYFIKCIALNNPTINREFPLLSCVNENGIRNFTNEVEGKVFYLDKTTVEDCEKYQGIKFKIICGYYFTEGRNNKIKSVIRHLFNNRLLTKSGKVIYNGKEKKYTVQDILNGKRENEILEAKEKGVEVEEVCNPIQSVYKLLMNSCYGKCLLKPIDTDNKIVLKKDWDKYISRNYNFLINAHPVSFKYNFKTGETTEEMYIVKEQKPICSHFNIVHAGVEILSMAKRIMNEVMCLAEDKKYKIYYTDTDSMHIEADKVKQLGIDFKKKYNRDLIGEDMGQFHTDFELAGCKDIVSKASYFLGKKAYIDKLEGINKKTNKKEIGHHVRMKGVNYEGIEHFKNNNNHNIKSLMEVYEKLYQGEELAFDLLAGGKLVKFQYNKDMSVSSRSNFVRHVSFNLQEGIETY